ncbi:MAG TPA: hypothetical protein VM687_01040 [Stenotrophomonas sp.]|nr:hypothetical protein [Stenotrophomonas sp.]
MMLTLRPWVAWIVALLVASLLPALLFAVLMFDGRIAASRATAAGFLAAFVIALLHVLVLGLPVAVLLRRKGRFGPGPMLAAGFVAGVVPCGLFLLLQSLATREALASLLNPVIGMIVLSAGGFGALAALGLWLMLRLMLPWPARR